MKLSLKELNDLYYCVHVVSIKRNRVKLIKDEELNELEMKLWNEIVRLNNEEEENDWIEELDDNVVNCIGVF